MDRNSRHIKTSKGGRKKCSGRRRNDSGASNALLPTNAATSN